MIKEILINDPITFEYQPDGGKTPMIDPYDGCQLCCPYCFQQDDPLWNKKIFVHKNIAELLNFRLRNWEKSETIYFGSKCDPYMPLEKDYRLTRKCLEILNELKISTMITTKSDTDLIFEDVDIISNFKTDITILLGISNLNQLTKNSKNKNILTANKLYNLGISVWVFITPVLPLIMDVDDIISAINPQIPIYLDKLRINKNTVQSEKMLNYIVHNYPEYTEQYLNIINNGNEDYYKELRENYSGNKRVDFLF